jgi:hypothetical protein
MSDCATYRSQKIMEEPGFCGVACSEYGGDGTISLRLRGVVSPRLLRATKLLCVPCDCINHWNGCGSEQNFIVVRRQEKPPQDSLNPAAFYR